MSQGLRASRGLVVVLASEDNGVGFRAGEKAHSRQRCSALPWGQLKRIFGRLLESAAVYRLSSNLRWFGRLSESVAVYRLSEGISESAAVYRINSGPL